MLKVFNNTIFIYKKMNNKKNSGRLQIYIQYC